MLLSWKDVANTQLFENSFVFWSVGLQIKSPPRKKKDIYIFHFTSNILQPERMYSEERNTKKTYSVIIQIQIHRSVLSSFDFFFPFYIILQLIRDPENMLKWDLVNWNEELFFFLLLIFVFYQIWIQFRYIFFEIKTICC